MPELCSEEPLVQPQLPLANSLSEWQIGAVEITNGGN